MTSCASSDLSFPTAASHPENVHEGRMSRIALVVSDVDGTLLTKDKTLTDGARRAVRRLHEAAIGFTIISSRPIIGMGFLIEPLAITLPVGAFNGSSIVDSQLNLIEQHIIPPAAAERS